MLKQGYVISKSYTSSLQRPKEIWMILKGNILYIYKYSHCQKLIEKIDLNSYKNAKISNSKRVEFELISKSGKNNKIFISKSIHDINDWIKYINLQINKSSDNECKQNQIKLDHSIKWQWKIDEKDWMSYNDKLSQIIEKLNINESYTYYKSHSNKTCKITKISKSTAIEKLESSPYHHTVSWPLRRVKQNKYSNVGMEKNRYSQKAEAATQQILYNNIYLDEVKDTKEKLKKNEEPNEQLKELLTSQQEDMKQLKQIIADKDRMIQEKKQALLDNKEVTKHQQEQIKELKEIIAGKDRMVQAKNQELLDLQKNIEAQQKQIKQCCNNDRIIKTQKQKIAELKKEIGLVIWQWKKYGNDEWVNYEGDYNEIFDELDSGKVYEYTTKTNNNYQFIKKTRISGELISKKTMKKWKVRRIIQGDKIQNECLKNEIERLKNDIKDRDKEIEELKPLFCGTYTFVWQCKDNDKGEWTDYSCNECNVIEKLDVGASREYKAEGINFKMIRKTKISGEIINQQTMEIYQIRRIQELKEIVCRDRNIKRQKDEILDKDKIIKQQKDEIELLMNENVELNNQTKSVVSWEWEIDSNSWIEYPDNISKRIEVLNIGESMQYTLSKFYHRYKITKESQMNAIQINLISGNVRNVRRIERKMIVGANNVNYPNLWNGSLVSLGSKYVKPKLVSLSLSHSTAKHIKTLFYKTVNDHNIIKIELVQNQMLYDSYWNERKKLIQLIGEKHLNEKPLFHGTKHDVMNKIQIQGFRKEFNGRARFGAGTYFARDANYSISFAEKNKYGIYKMFLCHVICGEMHPGNNNYGLRTWPTKENDLIYDSLVDNTCNPSIFVIHENIRAYPMFVIHFKKT